MGEGEGLPNEAGIRRDSGYAKKGSVSAVRARSLTRASSRGVLPSIQINFHVKRQEFAATCAMRAGRNRCSVASGSRGGAASDPRCALRDKPASATVVGAKDEPAGVQRRQRHPHVGGAELRHVAADDDDPVVAAKGERVDGVFEPLAERSARAANGR